MKILIVNGYPKTTQGINAFADFQYLIQKLLSLQRELSDTETEFFIRDRDSLDDFLYELDSSYVRREAANQFDHLDLIFVTSEPGLLPWHRANEKIFILLRMCLRVKKFLFTAGSASQGMVFLSATNFEKNIRIINGRGKGGKIGDFKSLDKDLKEVKQNDFFLDNITGDLYTYSYENEEWVAKANTGLHYQKAASEFQTIGKFIIKAPIYRPKSLDQSLKNLFVSRNTEVIGYLKKTYLHHWALKSLPSEFLVPLKTTWLIHPFAYLEKSKKFEILAESEKGAIIFEFTNILCCLFEIDSKYAETHVPLSNFILHKIRMIKSNNKSAERTILSYYQTIENVEALHREMRTLKSEKGNKTRTFRLFDEEGNQQLGKTFHHAGLAMKHHGEEFYVIQNTVASRSYKMRKNPPNSLLPSSPPPPSRPFIISSSHPSPSLLRNPHSSLFHQSPLPSYPPPSLLPPSLSSPSKISAIRLNLHPNIDKDCIGDEYVWVPGMYSQTKKLYSDRKIIRVKTGFKEGGKRKWEGEEERREVGRRWKGGRREEEEGRRKEGGEWDKEGRRERGRWEDDERRKEGGECEDEEGRKREEEGGRISQFVSYSKVNEKKRTFLFDYEKEVELTNKEGYKYREEQKEKWLSRTFKF